MITFVDKDLSDFNRRNQDAYSVSVDWAQIHVKHSLNFGAILTARHKIERTGQTKVFKDVFSIRQLYGRVVASYATSANDCILAAGHGILKLENSILYTEPNLPLFIENLLMDLDFKFIGITRIDIAYDFQSFNNRRNPENFIRSFLNEKILKSGHAKFAVRGNHKEKNYYEWLKFGNPCSDVTYKLYNKTTEQREVENKPYIWDEWKKNPLLDLKKDMWRLEFTMTSMTAKIHRNEIDSIQFHNLQLFDLNNYACLFVGLFNHYFNFVQAEPGKQRKDRMKQVNLLYFDESLIPFKIEKEINPERKNSVRSTKIFLNKMYSHHKELRQFDENFEESSKEMITKLINLYNLEDWANNKGFADFIDKSTYSDDLKLMRDMQRENDEAGNEKQTDDILGCDIDNDIEDLGKGIYQFKK